MKLNMRSNSESKQGRIIKSYWCEFEEQNIPMKCNLRVRKTVKPDGKVTLHNDKTILILKDKSMFQGIIETSLGYVCTNCLTSDYIKYDYVGTGDWYNKEPAGCTCTRCNASTLK